MRKEYSAGIHASSSRGNNSKMKTSAPSSARSEDRSWMKSDYAYIVLGIARKSAHEWVIIASLERAI